MFITFCKRSQITKVHEKHIVSMDIYSLIGENILKAAPIVMDFLEPPRKLIESWNSSNWKFTVSKKEGKANTEIHFFTSSDIKLSTHFHKTTVDCYHYWSLKSLHIWSTLITLHSRKNYRCSLPPQKCTCKI